MQTVVRQLHRVARADLPVLLVGETGTGKGLAARHIHERSMRAGHPFIPLNTGAVLGSLVESELFGHERGAFTGAHRQRAGCFERARGGVLFLDEIGEAPPALQVKLLRALEDKEIQRVGGESTIPVNVRVFAATNRDLRSAMQTGDFREDLFYRLAVTTIVIPPLRERGDLDALVQHLMALIGYESETPVPAVSPAVKARFDAHTWPGNIRMLRNVLEHAVLMCDGEAIDERHLPEDFFLEGGDATDRHCAPGASLERLPTLEEAERDLVRRALNRTSENQSAAARLLGVSRSTVRRKIRKYGLDGRPVAPARSSPASTPRQS